MQTVQEDMKQDMELNIIQLQPGKNFISFESNPESAMNYFQTKMNDSTTGIIITRNPHKSKNENVKIFSFKELMEKDHITNLSTRLKDHLPSNKKSIILVDRIDYLIGRFSFEETIKALYDLNDLHSEKTTIITRVSEDSLTDVQRGRLFAEYRLIPKPEVFNQIKLQNDLFELLLFIDNSDTKISFKGVCKHFNITKATARKRIYDLHTKSLVSIKTDGRSKILSLTKEGEQLCRDLS